MADEPVWEGLTARGGLGYMLSWNPGGNASEKKEWVTSSHVSGLLDIVVGSGNIESMVILTGWFSVCVCVLGRGLWKLDGRELKSEFSARMWKIQV